jgi:hypothetical protein
MSTRLQVVLLGLTAFGLGCGCTADCRGSGDVACGPSIVWHGEVATDAGELDTKSCVNEECVELVLPVQMLAPAGGGCAYSEKDTGTETGGWYMDGCAYRTLLDGSPAAEVQVAGTLRTQPQRLHDGDLATIVVRADGVPILSLEQRLTYHTWTEHGGCTKCKGAPELQLEPPSP